MNSYNVTFSDNINDDLVTLSEENNLKIQDIIRSLVFYCFEKQEGELFIIPEEVLKELKARNYIRTINRIKYDAMRDKRRFFLPSICRKFAMKIKTNNRNISEGDLRILLNSYLEESKLYGNQKEMLDVINSECQAIKIARGGYDD